MTTVLFLGGASSWYRSPILDPGEFYVGPSEIDRERTRYRPNGRYDVSDWIKKIGATPELTVCDFGNPGLDVPYNLAAVPGEKVLSITDVHHGIDMLSRAVYLAVSEPWDMVFLNYSRHHCHWFAEAGVKNVQWIPCFMISPYNIPPPAKRTRGVTFVGSTGMYHPRRNKILREIKDAGIDVEVICTGMDREAAAKIHNESAVSLNISLNGDFNLRNWEVMAAGGLLSYRWAVL